MPQHLALGIVSQRWRVRYETLAFLLSNLPPAAISVSTAVLAASTVVLEARVAIQPRALVFSRAVLRGTRTKGPARQIRHEPSSGCRLSPTWLLVRVTRRLVSDRRRSPSSIALGSAGRKQSLLWRHGDQALPRRLLTRRFFRPADCFAFFPGTPLRGFFIRPPPLHLAKKAFALELFLQALRAWSTLFSRTRTCSGNSFRGTLLDESRVHR